MRQKHYRYIDFLKAIAIFGVIIDHATGMLSFTDQVAQLSWYSVTLFTFLAGITSYISMERRKITGYDIKYITYRLKSLLIPYCVATAIVMAYNHKMFSLTDVLYAVFNFTASPPYYFILFFAQLIIISPLLFCSLKVIGSVKSLYLRSIISCFMLIFLVGLGLICTKYTYILPVHGGGQYLLGGSYLPIYFMGMLFAFFKIEIKHILKGVMVLGCSVIGLIVYVPQMWSSGIIIQKLNSILSIWYFNPPGMMILVYTILIFLCMWSIYIIRNGIIKTIYEHIYSY